MQPVYKRVKELKPHCPDCKEKLSGNNSIIQPYRCSCGEWHVDLTKRGAVSFIVNSQPKQ